MNYNIIYDCTHKKYYDINSREGTELIDKLNTIIETHTENKNKNKKNKNKKAKFICSLSVKYPKGKCITVVGQINGNISNEIKGKKGFGYDSIFIPKNFKLTFGQMPQKKKMMIDHRYVAFKKIKKKINSL